MERAEARQELETRKAFALLIYLAVSQRQIPRDLLADLLWGEMGEKQAKSGLRVALSNLRKIGSGFMIIDRQTAGCHPDRVWIDVEELVAANAQNARSAAYQPHTMTALEQAIGHYKGDFLAGFFVADAPAFEEWQRFQQERLRQIAQDSFFHLATYAWEMENFTGGIHYAQQLLQLVSVDDRVKLGGVVAAVRLRVFTALLSVMRHATCSKTATSLLTCDWVQF